jgi:hypothetical protein
MYKAATLALSNSISTIVNAIPTMDKIDEFLTLQGDKALDPAVRVATELVKNWLKKYWLNADDSDVYCIAMSNSHFNCYIFGLTLVHPALHMSRVLVQQQSRQHEDSDEGNFARAKRPAVSEPEEDTEVDGAADQIIGVIST